MSNSYRRIFGVLIDHIEADNDDLDPDSMASIVTPDVFSNEDFITTFDPKFDVTGNIPNIVYEAYIKTRHASKGIGVFKFAIASATKTQCAQMRDRLDYLLSEPYRTDGILAKPANDYVAIPSIMKTDEQPIFLTERETYEAILDYKFLYSIF